MKSCLLPILNNFPIGDVMWEKNLSSWGDHLNLTFDQMYTNIIDWHDLQILQQANKQGVTKLFPRFGFCLELQNYSLDHFHIEFPNDITGDVEVFITGDALVFN